MPDNHNQEETIRCSGCKKQFFADGFKVNRLGRRLKTCLECNARQNAEKERNNCPHGRQRSRCRVCGGVGICSHDRRRNKCHSCGGSQICEHDHRRETCRQCGGSQLCEHGRLRYLCQECAGAGICEHGKRRERCVQCDGSQICLHNRRRDHCWSCNPASTLWGRADQRIRDAIGTKARAGRSTAELLGCDKATFFNHIEALFKDGMCWARISEIEIDHMTPICYPGVAGGPPTLEEKVARLDYRNCQPLWAADNMAKGNRWADPPAEIAKGLTLTDADIEELLGLAL